MTPRALFSPATDALRSYLYRNHYIRHLLFMSSKTILRTTHNPRTLPDYASSQSSSTSSHSSSPPAIASATRSSVAIASGGFSSPAPSFGSSGV